MLICVETSPAWIQRNDHLIPQIIHFESKSRGKDLHGEDLQHDNKRSKGLLRQEHMISIAMEILFTARQSILIREHMACKSIENQHHPSQRANYSCMAKRGENTPRTKKSLLFFAQYSADGLIRGNYSSFESLSTPCRSCIDCGNSTTGRTEEYAQKTAITEPSCDRQGK